MSNIVHQSPHSGSAIDRVVSYVDETLPATLEGMQKGISDIETKKADKNGIPTKTSHLDNDSGYITNSDLDSFKTDVDKQIDDAIKEIEIESGGVGQKYIIDEEPKGEIFGDYENNKAITPNSIANGENTIAGRRGFTFVGTNKENKTLTLDSIYGLEVGDVISYSNLTQVYPNGSWNIPASCQDVNKIVAIDVENNVITLETDLPTNYPDGEFNPEIDGMSEKSRTSRLAFKVWINTKPEIGTSDISFRAFAAGDRTNASGDGSFVAGRESNAQGDYSVALGYKNNAVGQQSFGVGYGNKASGTCAIAMGYETEASGSYSVAEGHKTKAVGYASRAEGYLTEANSMRAHAEGNQAKANGEAAHAEGTGSEANAESTHAEGHWTTASGQYAHSEGHETVSSGTASHSEGNQTKATMDYAHAEGSGTEATERSAHAEGEGCRALGAFSHSEGNSTIASSAGAHAEGFGTTVSGDYSHSEGYKTSVKGEASHAEGSSNKVIGGISHAEGVNNKVGSKVGYYILTEDTTNNTITLSRDITSTSPFLNKTCRKYTSASEYEETKITAVDVDTNTLTLETALNFANLPQSEDNLSEAFVIVYDTYGEYALCDFGLDNYTSKYIGSHVEGDSNIVYASYSHAEGSNNYVTGENAHIEGNKNRATGIVAHVEGQGNIGSGKYSHAEGSGTTASGDISHAEGNQTTASGYGVHAEGYKTTASGTHGAHAEGSNTKANGEGTHAEGRYSNATATGAHAEGYSNATAEYAHSEGFHCNAKSKYSHAEGVYTTANRQGQHVEGKYNVIDSERYIHIVGNGTSDARSNAHTIDDSGNAWFAGDVCVGGTSQDDGEKLATLKDIDKQLAVGADGDISVDEFIELLNPSADNIHRDKSIVLLENITINQLHESGEYSSEANFDFSSIDLNGKSIIFDLPASEDYSYYVNFKSRLIKNGNIINRTSEDTYVELGFTDTTLENVHLTSLNLCFYYGNIVINNSALNATNIFLEGTCYVQNSQLPYCDVNINAIFINNIIGDCFSYADITNTYINNTISQFVMEDEDLTNKVFVGNTITECSHPEIQNIELVSRKYVDDKFAVLEQMISNIA